MSSLPSYYKLLDIPQSATQAEIRQAYKKKSLLTHPDRLPAGATPKQRKQATERFQSVADAYYVLSDPSRRKEYDHLFSTRRPSYTSQAPPSQSSSSQGFPGGFGEDEEYDEETQSEASGNFFQNFGNFFKTATGQAPAAGMERPDANGVFGDVFEEMLAPEVSHVRPFWAYTAGAAGGVIGYVVGNIPGSVAGAFAGNRLGAIRDAKGKSVAQVFQGMGSSQKAEILRALAFKVLGSMS